MGGGLKRRMERAQERQFRAEAYSQVHERLSKVEAEQAKINAGIVRIDGVLGKLLIALGKAGILEVQQKSRTGIILPPGAEIPEDLK